jgi:lysozyme family protein
MSEAPPWGQRAALPVDQLGRGWNRRFRDCLAVVASFEGGDSDHPSDPGGRTRWGVTERTFHAWLRSNSEPPRGVETMTPEEAAAVYWSRYWRKGRCEDMPKAVALAHFDAMIQHGPGGSGERGAVGATHLLQRALGVKDDGVVGPITLRAIGNLEDGMVEGLIFQRTLHYWRILDSRETLRVFSRGWRARVEHLRDTAVSWVPAASRSRIFAVLHPVRITRPENRPLPLPKDSRRITREVA